MAFELVFRQLGSDHAGLLPTFACGRASLDGFLNEDAQNFHKYGLTYTTLVFVQGDEQIAGYFSLSSDGVRLSTMEAGDLGLPFEVEIKYFPAVKITKFAVVSKYQRSGLGSQLIEAIEGLVYAGGKSVATRLLTVDAINEPDVIAFYTKAGFLEALEAQKAAARAVKGMKPKAVPKRETILMFKDIFLES